MQTTGELIRLLSYVDDIAATLSPWPDLVVGLAIAAVNAGAAHEVYEAAQKEREAVS